MKIQININTFEEYFNPISDKLPDHILEVYSGLLDFVENFGYIDNQIAKDSIEILEKYFNDNFEIDESEPFISTNSMINQYVEKKLEVKKGLTDEEKDIIVNYHITGYNVEEKMKMVKKLHEWFGFPLTIDNINEKYGNEKGAGINKLSKELLKAVKSTYSVSSARNLIYTVVSIDNSNIEKTA